MQQLIAAIDYKADEIHPEWESLFSTITQELSKEHKVSITYNARINLKHSKVELRLLNAQAEDWYKDADLRKKIIDSLTLYLQIFVLAPPLPV